MMWFGFRRYRKCWTSVESRPTLSTAPELCSWTNVLNRGPEKASPTPAKYASAASLTPSASALSAARYIYVCVCIYNASQLLSLFGPRETAGKWPGKKKFFVFAFGFFAFPFLSLSLLFSFVSPSNQTNQLDLNVDRLVGYKRVDFLSSCCQSFW